MCVHDLVCACVCIRVYVCVCVCVFECVLKRDPAVVTAGGNDADDDDLCQSKYIFTSLISY